MTGTRSSISRAHVTASLITTLVGLGNPVGDGNVPQGVSYGWQGAPNDIGSFFIPWLSVMPGVGRPSATTPGSFGDSGSEHVLSYSITINAVDREGVEWLADSTRKEMVNVPRTTLDCGVYGMWKIQQIRSTSIGGILRVRTTDPDYYVQTDGYDIWVSKEL